ncbi:hypothetical protein D9615_007958 [Tricholomella constricta]|uniref:Secreted protein n=1 Tax=Tricholomella constricta TaxID=117010 RepID=A0A8H5H2C3_9AGAR|nr:hypothetical protein D9615_007958 [Tricholomella constricta]
MIIPLSIPTVLLLLYITINALLHSETCACIAESVGRRITTGYKSPAVAREVELHALPTDKNDLQGNAFSYDLYTIDYRHASSAACHHFGLRTLEWPTRVRRVFLA